MRFVIALLSCLPLVLCFSWKSCGGPTDLVKIENLFVTQTGPLLIRAKGQGSLRQNLTTPLRGELTVKKKVVWGWVTVPCLDGVGSCKFKDICSLSPYKQPCPKEFVDQGLPCQCPIKMGNYSGSLDLNLNTGKLPKWLEKGSYKARALAFSGSAQIFCVDIEMKLK